MLPSASGVVHARSGHRLADPQLPRAGEKRQAAAHQHQLDQQDEADHGAERQVAQEASRSARS
jgi:hypothetical protein